MLVRFPFIKLRPTNCICSLILLRLVVKSLICWTLLLPSIAIPRFKPEISDTYCVLLLVIAILDNGSWFKYLLSVPIYLPVPIFIKSLYSFLLND